ncbi:MULTISPECIES: hypothetical protein [unclassified Phaeobacter]|uniref:hypothetical protein n=1 Tax=unclassified Phaeobacter TaxID=2621772 RepID=UPI003A85B087
MALEFKLKLADFVGLGILASAISASSYLLHEANLKTAVTEVKSELKLASQVASQERTQISKDLKDSGEEMKSLVQSALETRSEELALAFAELSGMSETIEVQVSNIPAKSEVYSALVDLANGSNSHSKIYQAGNSAIGTFVFAGADELWESELQDALAVASQEESLRMQVRILFPSDELSRSHRLSRRLVEKKISELKDVLNSLD